MLLDSDVTAVTRCPEGVAVTVERDGRVEELRAEVLLVATGRRPNTDLLDVAAGGLEVDEHGHLVDRQLLPDLRRPGVWAFGDAANHFQLKHMANAEARIVTHNLAPPRRPAAARADRRAARGVLRAAGRERRPDRARGARAPASTTSSPSRTTATPPTAGRWRTPPASSRSSPTRAPGAARRAHHRPPGRDPAPAAAAGDDARQTVDQLAHDVLYVHPALTEVVEQALLAL